MSALFDWRDEVRRPPAGVELSSTDRLVAFGLSFYMDTETLENCRPGPSRVARETALSVRTVKAATRRLLAAGYLERVSKGGTRPGSKQEASVYRGTFPPRAADDPVQHRHGVPRAGDARDPVQEDHGTRAGDAHHLATDLATDLGGWGGDVASEGIARLKAENPWAAKAS